MSTAPPDQKTDENPAPPADNVENDKRGILTKISSFTIGLVTKSIFKFFKSFWLLIYAFVSGVIKSTQEFINWVVVYVEKYVRETYNKRWPSWETWRQSKLWHTLMIVLVLISPVTGTISLFGTLYAGAAGLGLLREIVSSIQAGEIGNYAEEYMNRLWAYIKTGGRGWNYLSIPRFFTPLSNLFESNHKACYLKINNTDLKAEYYNSLWVLIKNNRTLWSKAYNNNDLSYLDSYLIDLLEDVIPTFNVSYIFNKRYRAEKGSERYENERRAFKELLSYIYMLISMDKFNRPTADQESDSSVRKILRLVEEYMNTFQTDKEPSNKIKLICSQYEINSREYSLAYKGLGIPMALTTWGMSKWDSNFIQSDYDVFVSDVNLHLQSVLNRKGAIEICERTGSKSICFEAKKWYNTLQEETSNSVIVYKPLKNYENYLKKLLNQLKQFRENPQTNPDLVTSANSHEARQKLIAIRKGERDSENQLDQDYETLVENLQRDLTKFDYANPDITQDASARVIEANKIRSEIFKNIYKVKNSYVSFKNQLDKMNANILKYNMEGVAVDLIDNTTRHISEAEEKISKLDENIEELTSKFDPAYSNVLKIEGTLLNMRDEWLRIASEPARLKLNQPPLDDLLSTLNEAYTTQYKINENFGSIPKKIKKISAAMQQNITEAYKLFYKSYGPLVYGLNGVRGDSDLKDDIEIFIADFKEYGGKPPNSSDLTQPVEEGPQIKKALAVLAEEEAAGSILTGNLLNPNEIERGCNRAMEEAQKKYAHLVGENWKKQADLSFFEGLNKLRKELGDSHHLVLKLSTCKKGDKIIGRNRVSVKTLYTGETNTIERVKEAETRLENTVKDLNTTLLPKLAEGDVVGRQLLSRYQNNKTQFLSKYEILKNQKQTQYYDWVKDLKTSLRAIDKKLKPMATVDVTNYNNFVARRDTLERDVMEFIKEINFYEWPKPASFTPGQLADFVNTYDKNILEPQITVFRNFQIMIGKLLEDMENSGLPSGTLSSWVKGVWSSAMGYEAAKQVERTLTSTGKFVNGEPASNLTEEQKDEYMKQIEEAKMDVRYNTLMWGSAIVGMSVILGYLWKKLKSRQKRRKAKLRTMTLIIQGMDSEGNPVAYPQQDYVQVLNRISNKFGLDVMSSPRISPKRSQMKVKWLMSEEFLYRVHESMIKYMIRKKLTTRALAQRYLDRTFEKLQLRAEGNVAHRWDVIYLPLILSNTESTPLPKFEGQVEKDLQSRRASRDSSGRRASRDSSNIRRSTSGERSFRRSQPQVTRSFE